MHNYTGKLKEKIDVYLTILGNTLKVWSDKKYSKISLSKKYKMLTKERLHQLIKQVCDTIYRNSLLERRVYKVQEEVKGLLYGSKGNSQNSSQGSYGRIKQTNGFTSSKKQNSNSKSNFFNAEKDFFTDDRENETFGQENRKRSYEVSLGYEQRRNDIILRDMNIDVDEILSKVKKPKDNVLERVFTPICKSGLYLI